MLATGTRLEKDSMGELEVPAFAMFGATTQRARLNFPISNLRRAAQARSHARLRPD